MTDKTLYSREEVLLNFQAMMNSLDFKAQLNELGYGAFSPFKRKKALREYRALAIALWQLAIERSFPDEHSEFFDVFLKKSPSINGGKEQHRLLQRVSVYLDTMSLKKDSDFMPAAQYFIDTIMPELKERKNLELKTTLFIRNLYKLIFDKLI